MISAKQRTAGPLSRAGTNIFVKNLKLEAKDDDVTKRRQHTGSFNRRPHEGTRRGNGQNQQRGCYNCGERNHVTSNCRHGQPIVCATCNRSGHKAKFCSQR